MGILFLNFIVAVIMILQKSVSSNFYKLLKVKVTSLECSKIIAIFLNKWELHSHKNQFLKEIYVCAINKFVA